MKLPNFDRVDSDGRSFCEISLPGGTFRMFEDQPYQWRQVLKPGEMSLFEKIDEAYASGNLK